MCLLACLSLCCRVITAPNTTWAQRKDKLILTIECPNCKQPKLRIENDLADNFGILSLQAEGSRDGEKCEYDVKMELHGELNKEESKVSVTDRNIVLVLFKDKPGPYWPRLLHAKGKAPQHIKVDWNLYKDEDEEEEEENRGAFDVGALDDFSVSGNGCVRFCTSESGCN